MTKYLLILTTFFMASELSAQDSKNNTERLPYYEIPNHPEKYTTGGVMARMVDGLGYRYYWATDSLRAEDLEYKPSEDSRDAGHTLEHIYELSITVLTTIQKKPNIRPFAEEKIEFEEMRKRTLQNFEAASTILRENKKKDFKESDVTFKRGDKSSSFPFWNMINGPIMDAIYHTGQIVAYRRASGNPVHSGMNVFRGKTRE
ncbi:MAG: DinB family protein [Chitinophagales bacterium]